MDVLVRELLGPLSEEGALWTALARDYEVQVRFAMHTSGFNRGFSLGPEASRLLARTGAALEFDLYFYGEEDD